MIQSHTDFVCLRSHKDYASLLLGWGVSRGLLDANLYSPSGRPHDITSYTRTLLLVNVKMRIVFPNEHLDEVDPIHLYVIECQ